MTNGAETVPFTKTNASKLRIAQRRMKRSMKGVTIRKKIRNENLPDKI